MFRKNFLVVVTVAVLAILLTGCTGADGVAYPHLITPEPGSVVAGPTPPVVPVVVPTVTLPTVTPEPTATPVCDIKGNIDEHGHKIYYMPGQVDYSRTVISPAKGEKFFCTEADAQAAGFRKAKR